MTNTIASDTLVEAIARALCEQHIREVRQWDTDPRKLKRMLPEAVDYSWTDFVDRSTTALTAITEAGFVVCPREPTEAMCDAGNNALCDNGVDSVADDDAPSCYRAMVNAAQGGGE